MNRMKPTGSIALSWQATHAGCDCDLHTSASEFNNSAAATHRAAWQAAQAQRAISSFESPITNREAVARPVSKLRLLRWMRLQLALHTIGSIEQFPRVSGPRQMRMPRQQNNSEVQS